MAGFEVILYGRFWVIAEEKGNWALLPDANFARTSLVGLLDLTVGLLSDIATPWLLPVVRVFLRNNDCYQTSSQW
jgi:hypothetical protein